MPEHPEVPISIPIQPAYMAQIEQLTAEGREVLRTVAEFSARVAPIIEHMDELRYSVGYDDDAIAAIASTTGWDELMETIMAIVSHAEAAADDCPDNPPAWYARLLDQRRQRWEGVA